MDYKEIERILNSLEDQFKGSVVSEQLTKVRDYIELLMLDNATKTMELIDLHDRCHQTKDKIREIMQTMTQTLEEIMRED